MPIVDDMHRSPLQPDARPKFIAINEITEGNHWCLMGWNVQAQRGRREHCAKCLSFIYALVSDLGIALYQSISPEPGVLSLPPTSGLVLPSTSHRISLSLYGNPARVNFSPIICPRLFVCLDFRSLPASFYKGGKKRRTFLITRGILTHAAFW